MRQNYLTRALQARDPRFAKIADRLGYGTRQIVAEAPKPDEMTMLRAEYERVIGRRPYMGWDAPTLREKVAAAKEDRR